MTFHSNTVHDSIVPIVAFIPPPLADELLYDICAKYQIQTGLSASRVRAELFGYKEGGTSIDFPSRLAYLAERLSWTGIYSVEQIIQRHSMLPLYAPFLPKLYFDRIKTLLAGNNGSSILLLVGDAGRGLGNKARVLHYCPLCQKEEPIPYWHRVHQVRGVFVCPTHKTYLEESPIASFYRWSINRFRFFTADADCAPLRKPRFVEDSELGKHLLRIAEDVLWLLTKPKEDWDLDKTRGGYKSLLIKQGFMSSKRDAPIQIHSDREIWWLLPA